MSATTLQVTMKAWAGATLAALALGTLPATAAGVRFHGGNGEGGEAAGAVHAFKGPNGGAYVGGHVAATDGQGNAGVASAEAVRGPNGGKAARAGKTTRQADGTLTHQSGFKASGAKGTAQSGGGFTRNPDGTASGARTTSAAGTAGGSYNSTRSFDKTSTGTTAERDTTATNKAGDTYTGETTYNSQTGVTHSATCTDPSGTVIPCRK
jgi:hypothetical protein